MAGLIVVLVGGCITIVLLVHLREIDGENRWVLFWDAWAAALMEYRDEVLRCLGPVPAPFVPAPVSFFFSGLPAF